MEFCEYLSEFQDIIHETYPNEERHTIENYLATFAVHPPILEELESPKCAFEAEAIRVQANKIFILQNYKEAAIMYTCSLRKAPPYSKCAALAYANRSAALYHLKEYKECILDVNRALDLPYPDDLRNKIISRKEAAFDNLNKAANQTNNNLPIESLNFAHGSNARLPGASHGIDIVYNPQDGHKLIAKMPFHAGDLLIVQNPFMPVIELNEDPAYCHHCLKKSLCLVPCDQCSEVYCSVKCRTESYDNYHRIECRILYTLMSASPLNVQTLVCVLRCLNILTEQGNNLTALQDELNEVEQNLDPERLGFTGEQFIGNTRKAFLSSLYSKEVEHDPGTLFKATYIATLLRNYTNFFKKNSDVSVVAKLTVKLNAAYAYNHFSIPYFGETEPKAHATFPLFGLVSHACVTNTITYIDDIGRMVLRASQYIRPGDQLLHSYHDLIFSFEEAASRTCRLIQCKRICKKCDKSYVYPSERQPHIKMDKNLRSKLRKNPYDIQGLWKILNLAHGRHQRYTLQAQMIKIMLVNAYEGRSNHLDGIAQLSLFGIL